MESIISVYTFSSIYPILLVSIFGILLLIIWFKRWSNKKEIHNRLLEIAFERGVNEKSSLT